MKDEWVYLFLDAVSLRVRRSAGRQRVQLLVAYWVRADGSRQLLGFLRSRGENQATWEGLLMDLFRRGLEGRHLQLIITDGCQGWWPPCKPSIRRCHISAAGCTR